MDLHYLIQSCIIFSLKKFSYSFFLKGLVEPIFTNIKNMESIIISKKITIKIVIKKHLSKIRYFTKIKTNNWFLYLKN